MYINIARVDSRNSYCTMKVGRGMRIKKKGRNMRIINKKVATIFFITAYTYIYM